MKPTKPYTTAPDPRHSSTGIQASEEVLKQLAFSADNIVEAATHNPVLFMRAVNARTDCLHDTNRAKMALKQLSAMKELQFRKEAKELGEKITEGHIEARLALEPSVIKAEEALQLAEEREENAKLVVEAFRQRRDMIQSVTTLVRDEVSISRAMESHDTRLNEAREQIRKKFPGSSA